MIRKILRLSWVLICVGFIGQPFPAFAQDGIWQPTEDMTPGRERHTATLLNDGRVLVVAGGGIIGPQNTAQLYDPVTDTFTATGALSIGHGQNSTATRLRDGTVLVVGGFQGGVRSTAEIYDPTTGTFSLTGSLNLGRNAHSATLMFDGRVLVAGGVTGTPSVTTETAEIYDPATGQFTFTDSMSTDRAAPAILLANGMVLIVGGTKTTSPGFGISLSSAEIYDPWTETFTPTGSMNIPRTTHTLAMLVDGRILVTGSLNVGRNTAELYDPNTGQFSLTGNMTVGRGGPKSTRLTNGTVLVSGGSVAAGPVTTDIAEVYNPISGTFMRTADMTSPRQGHTSTLLKNGQVLVTGGTIGGIPGALATAELFIVESLVNADARPGNPRNPVNTCAKGSLTVAVLGSDTFDATTVDPDSLLFAGSRVRKVGQNDKQLVKIKDANHDGIDDLVVKVTPSETNLISGDTEAVLVGETSEGSIFQTIVPVTVGQSNCVK
jgi:hypothetical protein